MQNLGLQVLFKGNNFIRLLEGLMVSLRIALLAMVISIIFGIIMGLLMTGKSRIIKRICQIYLEIVRIMPQLVLLFLVYFGSARHFGLNLPAETAAIIVFSFWGTAEMGDLVRGALEAIPGHQYESAMALGLHPLQTFISVTLPQIVRRLIPASVNLLSRMIKTTSLVVLIGIVEVVKVGKQIIDASRYEVPGAAIWVYGAIFILYFLICFPFSKASQILERRLRI